VKGHVDDILMRKNNETRTYQAEVVRLQGMHDQLLQYTKNKLGEYGLSMSELGYVPKRADARIMNGTASNPLSNTNGFRSSGPAQASEQY
jgi:hypothetical protein